MKNRKTIMVIVIVVAILLIAIVGATFAYFSVVITERDKTETRLHASELGIIFNGSQEITASNVEPGWSQNKKFTVENTSDYDMSYDINFTKVVNNFSRTSDLTARAEGAFIDSYHESDTVEMIGLNDTDIGASTKVPFELPNDNFYVLPTDNTSSVNNSTTPPTITRGEGKFKVARVYIPAHSKQEITLTFSYAYLAPSRGYTIGDSNDPNNQNVDKGKKVFMTTIEVYANGIDPDSFQENPTNTFAVLNGAHQDYDPSGNERLTFRFDVPLSEFNESGKVYMDNTEVDSSNYDLEDGSTIVLFKKTYTDQLSTGNHIVKVATDDGEAIASFTVTATGSGSQSSEQNSEPTQNEPVAFNPTYFGYLTPQSYQLNINEPVGKGVFIGSETMPLSQNARKGVCIKLGGIRTCFEAGASAASTEQTHLQEFFENQGGTCSRLYDNQYSCTANTFTCSVADTGVVSCYESQNNNNCTSNGNNVAQCQ